MDLRPGTMLLKADATSTYTSIQTHPAFNQIAQYLNVNKELRISTSQCYVKGPLPDYEKCIFRFSDSHRLQIKGTAMGKPPEPTYATFFYGIFE